MSYLVLARKYRPATFSEVVGQEHVTRTLANAFSTDRVHHAFLFCGPRGCGKTTVARIVGKALNCEATKSSATAEPCGTCSACTSIGNGSAIDYQEMDGASNRGIDAIRELTEAVRYQPAVLRKKVYVIDEVHMLTTEAFNALLKTLEEPPPHVTFVLATTEPHKLPNTILSRCQRYDFKLVPASRLGQHLATVFEREHLAVEASALSLLVRESGGSVRDALSLCDQLISYVGPNSTMSERHVAEVLGVADRSLTRTLVRALAAGEAGTALGAVESAIERGVDEVQLARAIVRYLRDLSVLQVAPDRPELIDAADEERTELLGEAKALERSRITQMFERMLRCCDELGKTLQPRLVLDCALIDVATVEPLLPLGDLLERLGELEGRLLRGGARSDSRAPSRAPARQPEPSPYTGGSGVAPTKPSMTGLLDAALEEDRPARKQAPSFATGTAPGQRSPMAPPPPSPAPRPAAPATQSAPAASPSPAQSAAAQSGAPQSGAAQSAAAQSGAAQSGAAQSGAAQSGAAQSGAQSSSASAQSLPSRSTASQSTAPREKGAPPDMAKGSRAEAPRPDPKAKRKSEFAAGTGTGGGNDEVAGAIAAARAAKDAADASRASGGMDRGMDVPHPADIAMPALAETKRGSIPEVRAGDMRGGGSDARGNDARGNDARGNDARGNDARGNDARGNDARGNDARGNDARGNDSPGVPSAVPEARSAATASVAPSGPVPAAPSVASGSGPHEQLVASPTDVLRAWNVVLGELETRRKFSLLGPFQHARVMKWGSDLIELGFPIDVHSMGEMASEQKHIDELRSIVRELGSELANVKIALRMLDATESAQGGVRSSLEDTRARNSAERQKREAEAREHPITKHVLQTFGAQIKEIKTDV